MSSSSDLSAEVN
jgi:hypothetical protein